MLKIAIIVGSTRDDRFGHVPAGWIRDIVAARADMQAELVDLRDHPLPSHISAEGHPAWQAVVAGYDGFILVTPEYNHGPAPATLLALDQASTGWRRKPVGFVGYGSVGAARAIEQLRLVCNALHMMPLSTAVHIAEATFFQASRAGTPLGEAPHLARHAAIMLEDLAWWARSLKAAREA